MSFATAARAKKQRLLVIGLVGSIAAVLFPIAFYPMLFPEKQREYGAYLRLVISFRCNAILCIVAMKRKAQ